MGVFELNLADCQKFLDTIKINGSSCSPKLADFTGKSVCLSTVCRMALPSSIMWYHHMDINLNTTRLAFKKA